MGFSVPATANSTNNVPVSYYANYSAAWNSWLNASGSEDTWPIRRVTFHQHNSDSSILAATVPLRVAQAEDLFSSHDDLTIDLPAAQDQSSTQPWQVDASTPTNPLPLARQARGDYSWFITVVPKTVEARNALASSGGGQAYDVSVVVFYKRVLNRVDPVSDTEARDARNLLFQQERSVRAQVLSTGPSGGEVLLTAYDGGGGGPNDSPTESPFTNLKVGEWMMLCGPHPNSTDLAPRFAMNWYRVLAIEGKDQKLDSNGVPTNAANQPERRRVALRGPQWPWQPGVLLSNWLCGGIFPGAVAVHNKTIQLESSTAFGGSGGGGGASSGGASRVGY
jgi:hypothetical protein